MEEKIKVLIVDDNQKFAKTLSKYIQKQEDMEVIGIARDGNEAIQFISNNTLDIVLLDIIMPVLDGIGVLDNINEIRYNKPKPIFIIMSVLGQDKIIQKALNLGAEYYVVKPFDIDLLIKRIRELKNSVSTQTINSFIGREIKQQYIEIPLDIKNDKENLEALVTNIIHDVGVPAHIKGYQYLREAIISAVNNINAIDEITKGLYPEIAYKLQLHQELNEQYVMLLKLPGVEEIMMLFKIFLAIQFQHIKENQLIESL